MAIAQTTRNDWIDEALNAISEEGFGALRVEHLARRLGVSKGGFYWNFENREDLLKAVLEKWEKIACDDVIRLLDKIEDPILRLKSLLDITGWRVPALRLEAAFASADLSGNTTVAAVYDRVNKRRIDYVLSLYLAMGLPEEEAKIWATSGQAAFLGTAQLVALSPDLFTSREELVRHSKHIGEQALPPELKRSDVTNRTSRAITK